MRDRFSLTSNNGRVIKIADDALAQSYSGTLSDDAKNAFVDLFGANSEFSPISYLTNDELDKYVHAYQEFIKNRLIQGVNLEKNKELFKQQLLADLLNIRLSVIDKILENLTLADTSREGLELAKSLVKKIKAIPKDESLAKCWYANGLLALLEEERLKEQFLDAQTLDEKSKALVARFPDEFAKYNLKRTKVRVHEHMKGQVSSYSLKDSETDKFEALQNKANTFIFYKNNLYYVNSHRICKHIDIASPQITKVNKVYLDNSQHHVEDENSDFNYYLVADKLRPILGEKYPKDVLLERKLKLQQEMKDKALEGGDKANYMRASFSSLKEQAASVSSGLAKKVASLKKGGITSQDEEDSSNIESRIKAKVRSKKLYQDVWLGSVAERTDVLKDVLHIAKDHDLTSHQRACGLAVWRDPVLDESNPLLQGVGDNLYVLSVGNDTKNRRIYNGFYFVDRTGARPVITKIDDVKNKDKFYAEIEQVYQVATSFDEIESKQQSSSDKLGVSHRDMVDFDEGDDEEDAKPIKLRSINSELTKYITDSTKHYGIPVTAYDDQYEKYQFHKLSERLLDLIEDYKSQYAGEDDFDGDNGLDSEEILTEYSADEEDVDDDLLSVSSSRTDDDELELEGEEKEEEEGPALDPVIEEPDTGVVDYTVLIGRCENLEQALYKVGEVPRSYFGYRESIVPIEKRTKIMEQMISVVETLLSSDSADAQEKLRDAKKYLRSSYKLEICHRKPAVISPDLASGEVEPMFFWNPTIKKIYYRDDSGIVHEAMFKSPSVMKMELFGDDLEAFLAKQQDVIEQTGSCYLTSEHVYKLITTKVDDPDGNFKMHTAQEEIEEIIEKEVLSTFWAAMYFFGGLLLLAQGILIACGVVTAPVAIPFLTVAMTFMMKAMIVLAPLAASYLIPTAILRSESFNQPLLNVREQLSNLNLDEIKEKRETTEEDDDEESSDFDLGSSI